MNRIEALESIAREIRSEILKMVHHAQSGHPGGSLSATEILTALYFDIMKVDPENPGWEDRDRFVLSKGHACPVWYATLALRGYFNLDLLSRLRQFESPLQGHPVQGKVPGVDATTGSLGIGMCEAVGMALNAKLSGKSHNVFTVIGDGESQEGAVWEAANAAARFSLDNLVVVLDNNGVQNDGFTREIMPVDPVDERFRNFGWEVFRIDGHDMAAVVDALSRAKAFIGKPCMIVADTVKGKGVDFMENDRAWHGKPPNDDQLADGLAQISKGWEK